MLCCCVALCFADVLISQDMLEFKDLSQMQKFSVLASRWLDYKQQLNFVTSVTWPFQLRYMGILSHIDTVFSRLCMSNKLCLLYCRNMEDASVALLHVEGGQTEIGYERKAKVWNDFCMDARMVAEMHVPRFLWPMVVKEEAEAVQVVEATVVEAVPVVVLRRSQRVSRMPARYK